MKGTEFKEIYVLCVVFFSSCSKELVITPDVPFPVNELVNKSVKPGDNFYNYCNVTWIKNNPLLPDQLSKQYWIDPQYGVASFQKVILASSDPRWLQLQMDVRHKGRPCRSNVPDSYNYAMVGAVIGHELGHGFDTAGYQFGPNGEWKDWWTAQDKDNFFARTHKLAAHFSKYRPYPDKYPDFHANGEQTSVEDVADLNGLNAAFRAMVNHYTNRGATEEELLKAKQEFFLAYANLWCGSFSEEYVFKRILTNIHSVSEMLCE